MDPISAITKLPVLSHLKCMTCGHWQGVGDVASNLRSGWPVCCGETMRLFTQRQVDERWALQHQFGAVVVAEGPIEPGPGSEALQAAARAALGLPAVVAVEATE